MTRLRSLNTRYAGRHFRSRTEARWAVFFDCCGIAYQYEHEGFALPSGPYLPDFWLTGFRLWFEVKGDEPSEAERARCVELAELSQKPVLLAVGAPDERFQIIWFDDSGELEGVRFVIARDKHSAAGFWLLANEDGQERWLGGGDLTVRRGGPMLSGALQAAYDRALSERFERQTRERRFEPIAEWDDFRIDPAQPVEIRGAA